MKPLVERMTKGGAAKAWIKEVEAKDRDIELLEQTKDQYLNTIDLLACEKEQLETVLGVCRLENEALSELLSPLVHVELERDNLKGENEELREFVELTQSKWEEFGCDDGIVTVKYPWAIQERMREIALLTAEETNDDD